LIALLASLTPLIQAHPVTDLVDARVHGGLAGPPAHVTVR